MSELYVDFNEDYNGEYAVRVRGEHPLPRMVMHELSDQLVVDKDYEYSRSARDGWTAIGTDWGWGELTSYDHFVNMVSEIVASFFEDGFFDVSINPI